MAYEDLITDLRLFAKAKYEYENRPTHMSILLDEAADAIDELNVQLDEVKRDLAGEDQ